jgi:DnaK suppressor protein
LTCIRATALADAHHEPKEIAVKNTHLTSGQRALLQTELELRKRSLGQQLETHQEGRTRVEHARDVLERDYDDAPQRAMDREVDMALSEIDTRELAAINRALKRVHEVDYGLCEDCGAEIPFDRLKVEPHAQRCVSCETAFEQGRKKA